MRHRNRTSFSKGHLTWNKKEPLVFVCQYCGKSFEVTHGRLGSRRTRKFCGKECQTSYQKEHSKYKDLVRLRLEGKSVRELADMYGVTTITINSTLNRHQYRAPLGSTLMAIRRRVMKSHGTQCCAICGFARYVELAHIVKASRKGPMTTENTILLCPNHHRLYDSDSLTDEENRILEAYLKSRGIAMPT